MPNNKTIYNNSIHLDCFCADLIEEAAVHFSKNPKKGSNRPTRKRVKFWVENYFVPSLKQAIEDAFENNDY